LRCSEIKGVKKRPQPDLWSLPERPGVDFSGRSRIIGALRLTDYRAVPVFTGRMRIFVNIVTQVSVDRKI
jgi:hypothetical protein